MQKVGRVRHTGVWWGSGGGRSSLGVRKGASYLVPDSLLPKIHLILQIRWGHAVGQLVGGIDAQNLLCPGDHQDGWGWLHWQKEIGTGQHPSPCLQPPQQACPPPCSRAPTPQPREHSWKGKVALVFVKDLLCVKSLKAILFQLRSDPERETPLFSSSRRAN